MRYLPVLALLLWACPAWAGQTYFRARDIGNSRQLEYRWRDGAGEHALAFALNLDDLRQADADFQPFDNADAQNIAFKAVRDKAQTIPVPGGSLEVSRNVGGYDIRARGVDAPRMDGIAADLRVVRDQALDSYVASKFYSRIDGVHIMPDHKRIAQRYVPAMAPLARAARAAMLAEGAQASDPRTAINYLLGFLQNIPYDQLENRYTSNGAGFETPYAVLAGNKGDCDSKSVLLAATLRSLFPNLRLTMVYVPDHAFVGVALPQGKNDYALQLGGSVFVLADPTGPRLMNLGEVNPTALSSLNQGAFSYQEIPF